MTAELDPVAVVRRYHAAIDALDFAAIAAFFAEDAAYLSDGTGPLRGRAAIMAGFERYFAEYGDQESVDETMDLVAPMSVRSVWRLAATSARTAKALERRGEEIVTLDASGRIVEVRVRDA